MMNIFLQNLKYEYEIHMMIKTFTKIECEFEDITHWDSNQDSYVLVEESHCAENSSEDIITVNCNAILNGKTYNIKETAKNNKRDIKNAYKRCIYHIMADITSKQLPWGILTGIRPVKIIHELKNHHPEMSLEQIKSVISTEYLVSTEKVNLMEVISDIQAPVINQIDENSYSIYISIPFCPSRCNYCSFYSNDIKQKGHLCDSYIDALEQEIKGTLALEWVNSKRLDSIYIGGGTPTSLDAAHIERLLKFLNQIVDFSNLKEVTYEAGRPDTITAEKLAVLKKYGVDRISINPQSMVDKTLKTIGRNHDSKSIEDVFNLAREHGFDNINMDIILGLQDENLEDVRYTLEKISQLDPDSITMHTLSIKRASKLNEELDLEEISRQEKNITDMIDLVYQYMNKIGMKPYYLYRQKNILGGFENVGFAKQDKESWYNIVIMEEIQNIMAFGSGSVSRFIFPAENRIEKVSNIKNLESYLEKIDEMIIRKRVEMK